MKVDEIEDPQLLPQTSSTQDTITVREEVVLLAVKLIKKNTSLAGCTNIQVSVH